VRGENRNREGETKETGGRRERKTQKKKQRGAVGKESYRGRRKEKGEPPLVFLSTAATTPPLRREYRSTGKKKTEAHASA
jgi:hypothetical protein